MQKRDDNTKGSDALSLVQQGFLFKGHHPESAYRQALSIAEQEEDSPFGIKKAMIAAIKYNFALNSESHGEDVVKEFEEEYLKAVELLKKPRERYIKLKTELQNKEELNENDVRDLFEAEIAHIMAIETSISAKQRAEHLKSLIVNWQQSRHAVFSELLVRLRKTSDIDEQVLLCSCSNALLENPFYTERIDFIDASFNAYQLSKRALEEGQILEAHFFTVLKAAIDYNRVLHTEDSDLLSDEQIDEYAVEYEALRDSLLLDKQLH